MQSAHVVSVTASDAPRQPGGQCQACGQIAVLAGQLAALGVGELGVGELGVGELGAGELGAGELGAGELGAGELGAGELGAGELGAGELGAGELGAGELGAGEPAGEPEPCDGAPYWGPGAPAEPEEDLPVDLLIAQAEAAAAAAAPELLPAGFMLRDGDPEGTGFSAGGVLDDLEPGPVLAGFAADAAAGLSGLSDDELVGVVRAWRRLSSWTAACELAAVSELLARRERGRGIGPGSNPGCDPYDCAAAELACALTLTRHSAQRLTDTAMALRELPATAAALAAGRIDMPRALTVMGGVTGLDRRLAGEVEARVLVKAPAQTTGELRAALRRAVLAADPGAALRRRQRAQKDARVEVWDEPAGTRALAGRDLPPADVLAADERLTAIAHQLKANGAEGTIDQLRARAYLALLSGQAIERPAADLATADLVAADSPMPAGWRRHRARPGRHA